MTKARTNTAPKLSPRTEAKVIEKQSKIKEIRKKWIAAREARNWREVVTYSIEILRSANDAHKELPIKLPASEQTTLQATLGHAQIMKALLDAEAKDSPASISAAHLQFQTLMAEHEDDKHNLTIYQLRLAICELFEQDYQLAIDHLNQCLKAFSIHSGNDAKAKFYASLACFYLGFAYEKKFNLKMCTAYFKKALTFFDEAYAANTSFFNQHVDIEFGTCLLNYIHFCLNNPTAAAESLDKTQQRIQFVVNLLKKFNQKDSLIAQKYNEALELQAILCFDKYPSTAKTNLKTLINTPSLSTVKIQSLTFADALLDLEHKESPEKVDDLFAKTLHYLKLQFPNQLLTPQNELIFREFNKWINNLHPNITKIATSNLKKILQLLSTINAQNELFRAIEQNDIPQVKKLSASPINLAGRKLLHLPERAKPLGAPPIFHAVYHGHIPTVRTILLSHQDDLKSEFTYTPELKKLDDNDESLAYLLPLMPIENKPDEMLTFLADQGMDIDPSKGFTSSRPELDLKYDSVPQVLLDTPFSRATINSIQAGDADFSLAHTFLDCGAHPDAAHKPNSNLMMEVFNRINDIPIENKLGDENDEDQYDELLAHMIQCGGNSQFFLTGVPDPYGKESVLHLPAEKGLLLTFEALCQLPHVMEEALTPYKLCTPLEHFFSTLCHVESAVNSPFYQEMCARFICTMILNRPPLFYYFLAKNDEQLPAIQAAVAETEKTNIIVIVKKEKQLVFHLMMKDERTKKWAITSGTYNFKEPESRDISLYDITSNASWEAIQLWVNVDAHHVIIPHLETAFKETPYSNIFKAAQNSLNCVSIMNNLNLDTYAELEAAWQKIIAVIQVAKTESTAAFPDPLWNLVLEYITSPFVLPSIHLAPSHVENATETSTTTLSRRP